MASNRAGSACAASTSARSRSRWTRRGPPSSGRSTFQNAARGTLLHRLRDRIGEADVCDLADEHLAVAHEERAGRWVDAGGTHGVGAAGTLEADEAVCRDLSSGPRHAIEVASAKAGGVRLEAAQERREQQVVVGGSA